ncbi:hypothetical protein QR680_016240 [Steinernema hermaphroditum]|uniref:Uncharacterized protein n=1 Tax=Steinernema hermaphroditum TaxID=289476 RepID=A0AA39HAJ5_9BILA|nr:hypothetical protein QR680_016240 [Steinernema hermaphroditum]
MAFQIITSPSNDASVRMMDTVELALRKFQIRCEKAGLRNDKLFVELPQQVTVDTATNRATSSNNKTFVMPTESEMWDTAEAKKMRGNVNLVFFNNRREAERNEQETSTEQSISLLEL